MFCYSSAVILSIKIQTKWNRFQCKDYVSNCVNEKKKTEVISNKLGGTRAILELRKARGYVHLLLTVICSICISF